MLLSYFDFSIANNFRSIDFPHAHGLDHLSKFIIFGVNAFNVIFEFNFVMFPMILLLVYFWHELIDSIFLFVQLNIFSTDVVLQLFDFELFIADDCIQVVKLNKEFFFLLKAYID